MDISTIKEDKRGVSKDQSKGYTQSNICRKAKRV